MSCCRNMSIALKSEHSTAKRHPQVPFCWIADFSPDHHFFSGGADAATGGADAAGAGAAGTGAAGADAAAGAAAEAAALIKSPNGMVVAPLMIAIGSILPAFLAEIVI